MTPIPHRRPKLVARVLSCLAALVLAGAAAPLLAYNPNQPQGFDPERMYHGASVLPDQVDLFSGRLSVTLPIGPFTLAYNNNVWRYRDVIEGGQPRIQVWPDRLQNAGLGWHLGWGELYAPDHWYNDSVAGQWLYVDDSGARHFFYGALHRLESDGDGDVYYTRDNTYLRLRKIVAGSTWDIEFPDGTTRRFVKGGAGAPYRLTRAWSPHGSAVDPDFTITYDPDDKLRTLTDRHGRNHYVHLAGGMKAIIDGYPLSWMTRVITKVDVQGPLGQRLVYDFSYRNIPVDVSCKETSTEFGPQRRLPHLVKIDLPDGTAYEMQEADTTPSYVNTCQQTGIDDAPGSLTRMQLPTGGELRWSYQEYEFPPGSTWGPFNTSAGVELRQVLDIDDQEVGSWKYKTRDFGASGGNDPEMRTDVVALPEGDCTRHFFSALYYQSPAQGKGWEYGLPFTKRVSAAGRFLSKKVYTTHDAATGLCSGSPLRTTYLRYRHDPIPGAGTAPSDPGCQVTSPCSRLDEWYNTNRTVDATRTVFHDDGDRWIDTELSQFDGIGNFRKTVTTGNFWDGSANDERRETLTNFTRSPGTFPGGGYQHPSPTEPWLLGVFDRVDSSEPDADGETASRVEVEFDDTTGDLLCARTLASGFSRSLADIVVTYDYDARGNPTDVKTYGGDADPLSSTGGAGCGLLPSQPVYWTHHEYDYDVLARTRPYQPNGTPGPFLTHDVDVDPLSGVILASRSPAGFETTYGYDAAGRLMTMTPQDGASLTTTITNPTATETAKVSAVVAFGAQVFREEEDILDSFGREVEKRRKMPDGSWASRHREINVRGWLLAASEWNAPTVVTQYLGHDPFGRPGTIRPPEGASHDVDISYQGIREVTVASSVSSTIGGAEVTSTRTSRSDRYGRLRTVLEPSGPSGTDATTTYLYDVGGRMTEITTDGILGWTAPPDPQPIVEQQVRSYGYDNRGFLLWESHPEKGPTGNGTVTYADYDAAGNVGSMVDHNHSLGFEYDFMGRQTLVEDVAANPDRPLRSFVYDSALGFGSGKVHEAKAFNYLQVPATGLPFTVEVTQRFTYAGLGGRVNRKDTVYGLASGTYTMRSWFNYDDAGDLVHVDYPDCVTGCGTSRHFNRTATFAVDIQRSYGAVTGIPGWVDSVDYHPSGLWSRIDHANGVSDIQERDPFHRSRPSRIYFENAAQSTLWDSGSMSYDGSGNLTGAGSNLYAYDLVSRLKESQGDVASDYSYDAFGNLLNRSPVSLDPDTYSFPVDPETNRLTNATYDGAGNVLTFYGQIFAYDPFNRLINQAWMAYAYDAFGERAASFAASSTAAYFHLRGLDDELLTTIYYDGNSTFERQDDYVYLLGRPLAVKRKLTGTQHFHLDHLGTQKLRTPASGTGSAGSSLVSPYGVEMPGSSADNRLFTGHERDFSTDTDYMHARHYYSLMGRFLSVDSFRGNPGNPQSLNRYAYVMGNPINMVDPDGREGVDAGGLRNNAKGAIRVMEWAAGASDNPIVSGGLTVAAGQGTAFLGTVGLVAAGAKLAAECGTFGPLCLFWASSSTSAGVGAASGIDHGLGMVGDGFSSMLYDPFPWEVDTADPTRTVQTTVPTQRYYLTDFSGESMHWLWSIDGTPQVGEQMVVTARKPLARSFWETVRKIIQLIEPARSPDPVVELRNLMQLDDLRRFGNMLSPGLNYGTAAYGGAVVHCDASNTCGVLQPPPPKK